MDVPTVTLNIKIEPEGDAGIPIEMLSDYFLAHQETLKIIIEAECNTNPRNKKATIPQLRIIDVQHGSMEFKFLVDGIQAVMPVAQSYLGKMGTLIKDRVTGMDTFEATNTKSIRIPKRVTDRLSEPVLQGLVKSISAFEENQGVQTPVYSFTRDEVTYNMLEEEPEPTKQIGTTERGPEVQCEGELKEIDWDKKTCQFSAEIDGSIKKYKCHIHDESFLNQFVKGGLRVELKATPIFQASAMGERTIKWLEAHTITILENG